MKRVVTLIVLVALSGLLLFGAVHRTNHVLASDGQGVGTTKVHGAGQAGGGHGQGRGAGLGNGNGTGGQGRGEGY